MMLGSSGSTADSKPSPVSVVIQSALTMPWALVVRAGPPRL